MKSFSQLREASLPRGVTYSKRVKGYPTMVRKEGNKYVAFIDGDKLDSYSSEKEAVKMITQFMKNYKG